MLNATIICEQDGCKCLHFFGKNKQNKLSESALFGKCAQTHKEFVVVFKKLLVHTCMHAYIHTNPIPKKLGHCTNCE